MTIAARLTPFLETKEAKAIRWPPNMGEYMTGYGLANAASQSRIKFDPYLERPKGGVLGSLFGQLFG